MKVKEFIKKFEDNIKFQKNIMNNLDTFSKECKKNRIFEDYEGLKDMYKQSTRNSISIQKKSKMLSNKRINK